MFSVYQFKISCLGTHYKTLHPNLNQLTLDQSNEVHEANRRNAKAWYDQINTIFNEQISLPTFEDTYYKHNKENKDKYTNYSNQNTLTREWYNYTKNLLSNVDEFILKISNTKYTICNIIPMHNRYQRCIYLQVYFKGKVLNPENLNRNFKDGEMNFTSIKSYQNHLQKVDNLGFKDHFSYTYKEKAEYFDTDSLNSYTEDIFFCNPSLIYNKEDIATDNYLEIKNNDKVKDSKVKFDFDIRPDRPNGYSGNYQRGVSVKYILDGSSFKNISKHYTSIFILFQRTNCYVKEYMQMDGDMKLLYSISHKISQVWSKGRAYLMSLEDNQEQHKIFNNSYFKIMELNTLMDGEVTTLQSESNALKEKYDRQYDRVLSNINNFNVFLDEKHDYLLKLLQSPISYRDNLLNNIKNLKEPTDLQVQRLKDMFDSRKSSSMNKTMNSLTIIVSVFGVVTFLYGAIFKSVEVINLWVNIPFLVLLVGLIIISYFKFWKPSFNITEQAFTRECKNIINNIDVISYESLLLKIQHYNDYNSSKQETNTSKRDKCNMEIISLTDLLTLIIVYKIYDKYSKNSKDELRIHRRKYTVIAEKLNNLNIGD